MTDHPIGSQPLEVHVRFDPLIRNVLGRWGVHTVADMADLDLEAVRRTPGVAGKKTAALVKAQRDAIGLLNAKDDDRPQRPDTNGTQCDVVDGPITYVPGLLRQSLAEAGLTDVRQLVQWNVDQMIGRRGWGDGRLRAARDLQNLYRRIIDGQVTPESSLADLTGPDALPRGVPPATIVAEFVSSHGVLGLTGTAVEEAAELRRAAVSAFLRPRTPGRASVMSLRSVAAAA